MRLRHSLQTLTLINIYMAAIVFLQTFFFVTLIKTILGFLWKDTFVGPFGLPTGLLVCPFLPHVTMVTSWCHTWLINSWLNSGIKMAAETDTVIWKLQIACLKIYLQITVWSGTPKTILLLSRWWLLYFICIICIIYFMMILMRKHFEINLFGLGFAQWRFCF